jgi:hypothetical protein
MRFEPSGMTNDPDIRAAKSIVDYIFRWMGKKFLTVDQQEEALVAPASTPSLPLGAARPVYDRRFVVRTAGRGPSRGCFSGKPNHP